MKESARERLIRAFAAVFDTVNLEDIPSLKAETTEPRDSLAGVMLLSVVQQEFEVEFSVEERGAMDSFEKILERVQLNEPAD